MTEDFESFLKPYTDAVLAKKVIDPLLLDLRGITSIADAFIVCSATSNRQVTAISDHVKYVLKKQKNKPMHIDGSKEGHWIVMDYGDVIIHIFYEPIREFYDLEGLWVDAKSIKLKASNAELPDNDDNYEENEEY